VDVEQAKAWSLQEGARRVVLERQQPRCDLTAMFLRCLLQMAAILGVAEGRRGGKRR
jgi:hypothetical protein